MMKETKAERSGGRRTLGLKLVGWAVIAMAGCFGIAFAVLDNKVTRAIILDEILTEKPDRPGGVPDFDLRSVVLDRRDRAAEAGNLVEAAASNGVLAQEAILRSRAVHDAWMPMRDPGTKLFPQAYNNNEWNYRNTAADFFGFQFQIAMYTDAPTLEDLRESIRAESELSGPGELCQPVSARTGEPINESFRELMFASSEYVKDGLLSAYEAYGDEQIYSRMIEVVDAILAHSGHESQFGVLPDPRSEVLGEMLQTLSRLSLVSENDAYPEMAARIADAIIEQMLAEHNGLPAHTFNYETNTPDKPLVMLRDHGNEVVGGLAEVYALAVSRSEDPVWAERADRWAEPIAHMLELIFEVAINDAGLIVNTVDADTMTIVDDHPNDNWGYIVNGVLLFVEAAEQRGVLEEDRLAKLLVSVDQVVAAVVETDGIAWEGLHHDGYADTIESALYCAYHRPELTPVLLPWIDDQIGVMLGMQSSDGFVARTYLDGNFIRTSMMYADLRTGGWSVEPWSPDVRVGLASDDEGNGALVVESTMPYEGKLVYRLPAHALQRAIPWDWPRLNSWPRWLPPEAIADVEAVKGAEGVTVDALASGLPISLDSGGRVVLEIRMKAER